MSLNDLASWATIGAFLISIISIAFSARRYLAIRDKELASERFVTYHDLIKAISKGQDRDGQLKMVSQLAYIYELRNFPEYASLTKATLLKLSEEWQTNNPERKKDSALNKAIDETILALGESKT
ncbi:TPA: hypothetical protein ACN36G_004487 [Vibrio parahaemolyticus]|nr:hypothetical protein [Vibrio vulnificus]EHH1077217.1 hypothetical protein [Vibrio parahaemolyticus]EHH2471552.1 hypothetical protein [Vibrio vulnificus]EIO3971343.1 hypothetical protein [Vibrio vulnificus]ELE7615507.1 hypothetical protein [Vibrio vulnificus]